MDLVHWAGRCCGEFKVQHCARLGKLGDGAQCGLTPSSIRPSVPCDLLF